MARTTLTALAVVGTKTNAYSASAADLTMTAADVSNKNQVAFTGKELVVARNSGVGANTVTITSLADDNGRTGDVSAYSLAAGEYGVFGPFAQNGWRQADGYLYFEASSAEVFLGVIRIT